MFIISLLYLLLFLILPLIALIIKSRLKLKSPFFIFAILFLIIVNLAPLLRAPVEHTGELHESSNEPWAIGLGFPFSYIKYYLGEGWIRLEPLNELHLVDIHSGSTLWLGSDAGMVLNIYGWIYYLIFSFLITITSALIKFMKSKFTSKVNPY